MNTEMMAVNFLALAGNDYLVPHINAGNRAPHGMVILRFTVSDLQIYVNHIRDQTEKEQENEVCLKDLICLI